MDIKKIISDLVAKITGDSGLLAKFKKDPLKTVKSLLSGSNIKLPTDQLQTVVDGVQAKIGVDKAKDLLGGLGNLLGKK